MTIGERIRFHRKAAGLTQAELAARSGYSCGVYISRLERADVPSPRYDTLLKIAQALNKNVSDLLGEPRITHSRSDA